MLEAPDVPNIRDTLEYSAVGVFVGVEPSGLVIQDKTNVFTASGGSASITSGRFSYALGLVGPCYSIDTACSSTLTALHTCMTAIKGSECDAALGIGTKVLSEGFSF